MDLQNLNIKVPMTLLLCCVLSSASATRYYVDQTAGGNGNGLSWVNAMTDLQAALSITIFGDELWVATGQYKPTSSTDRTISFVVRDGVNVYGSFAGSETAISQRTIAANPTTLNGDIGALGSAADNSYHVVSGDNLSTAVTWDGFRIINGNSNSRGGGLYLTNALTGELLVKNCFFFSNESNNYGGAVYLAAANLRIEDCEFVSNESDNGGSICNGNNNGGNSSLTIRDTKFMGNTAYQGACLYNTLSYHDLLIDRCVFTNNNSPNTIVDIDDFNSARLVNSYFIGNTVDGSTSRVIYMNSFGSSGGDAQITNCTIAHNYNVYANPLQGEIVRLEETDYLVSNCIIYGNTPYNGAQMKNAPIVSHCLIEGGYPNGTNVIDVDPQFLGPNTVMGMSFDASVFDYTLMNSSPAINVGSNVLIDISLYALDLALNMRIQGLTVDLGCYESSITVSTQDLHRSDELAYYFDPLNRSLTFFDLDRFLNKGYMIFDSSGRLKQSGPIEGSRVQVDLHAGMYVALVEGGEALKFVVAEAWK